MYDHFSLFTSWHSITYTTLNYRYKYSFCTKEWENMQIHGRNSGTQLVSEVSQMFLTRKLLGPRAEERKTNCTCISGWGAKDKLHKQHCRGLSWISIQLSQSSTELEWADLKALLMTHSWINNNTCHPQVQPLTFYFHGNWLTIDAHE